MKKMLVTSMLLAAVAIATVPVHAASKKIRHSGQVVGVADSKVTLRVGVRDGKPRKVSAFKAVRVPTRCDSGTVLFRFEALDPTRVTRKGNFKEILKNPDGAKLTISGTVRRKGKRVKGYLKTNRFEGGGSAGSCKLGKTKYRTKKTN